MGCPRIKREGGPCKKERNEVLDRLATFPQIAREESAGFVGARTPEEKLLSKD